MPDSQENLIFIDDLTGLFNRRYLYSQLPKDLEEARINKQNLWVFMLDMDGFKMINDSYGHLSGDEIIKDLSLIIKENTKVSDKKIRYAGDEFTIIIPNIDAKDVLAIAGRLISKVDTHRFREKHSGKEIHVTISVGIAGYPQDSSDPVELINLADKALYISKQKGKNCASTVSEITTDLFWKKGLLERFPCPVLVGREHEFEVLNGALKQAFLSTASFVLINGPLGVGKSRLLHEFERSIRPQEALIFSAKCEDKFLLQPFYTLGRLLNDYFLSLEKIPSDLFEGLTGTEANALTVFMPVLKEPLKSISKATVDKYEDTDLIEAFIKVLHNIAKKLPLCMVFDDLHYLDVQSLTVLERFSQSSRKEAVLLLAAFSDQGLSIAGIGESPLADLLKKEPFQANIEDLNLSALSEQHVEKMVSSIFSNILVTKDLAGIIYQRTKGNPLFVEELLKYLIEKEFIYYKNGNWAIKPFTGENLPSSFEEAIKSRLADLDDETKSMIAKAAVIGDDFQVDLLHKIDSDDRGYVLDLMESAKKIGLIYQKGASGKDEFSFATAEIRNILLNAIGSEQTKHLYSQLGDLKERINPDKLNSIAGELYYNFKKAQDQVRADQYAMVAKEGKGALYDRTMSYAQSLMESSSQEKMLVSLDKKVWGLVPAVIKGIYMAGVNLMLYPPNNKMCIQSVEDAHKKLSEVFSDVDLLNIAVVGQTIIVNKKKVGKELASFFLDSFISVLRNLGVESISFQKGVEVDELASFIMILNTQGKSEASISDMLKEKNVRHIQVNEVTYDIAKKKTKEKESLEEIMLVDYLLGKLPASGDKMDLPGQVSGHAKEIAQALDKLGEEASKSSGKNKEAVKAEIMAKSIERLGQKAIEKGQDFAKYKEDLAKTILSMEPALRANIFSQEGAEIIGKDDKRINIMHELSRELPEDVIVDVLKNQYLQKDTDILKMKNMVDRFLSDPAKREKIAPLLKKELKQLGAEPEECEWILDSSSWDSLSASDKAKKIVDLPMKTLIKLLPLVNFGQLMKELLSLGADSQMEAVWEKLIKAFKEEQINPEVFVGYCREILEVLMQHPQNKMLPQFLSRLLKLYDEKAQNQQALFAVVTPFLVKITDIFLKIENFASIKDILRVYTENPAGIQEYSRIIEIVAVNLVDDLVKRIDLGHDWQGVALCAGLLRPITIKLLLDKALFETGVPEGKYFEAYLRRRMVGKVLENMPVADLLAVINEGMFDNSKPYIVKNLIEIIGAMDNPEVIKVLSIPLKNPDATIRRKVVFTLSRMRDIESTRLLGLALKDGDTALRQEALQYLKARKDDYSVNLLQSCLQDESLPEDIRDGLSK